MKTLELAVVVVAAAAAAVATAAEAAVEAAVAEQEVAVMHHKRLWPGPNPDCIRGLWWLMNCCFGPLWRH